MKVKKSSVCHTCRVHKIGCDGRQPACSQCTHIGRSCGGYQLDIVVAPYIPKVGAKKAASLKAPSSTRRTSSILETSLTVQEKPQIPEYQIPSPIGSTTSEQFTAVILSQFVPENQLNLSCPGNSSNQVCGSWVGVLPGLVSLSRSEELISLATRAFGAAILDQGREGKHKSYRSREAYTATLRHLKSAFASYRDTFRLELGAVIACLAMVELMLPTSDEAFQAHFRGLGALINLYCPELFSSNQFHAIFVGCRPVLFFEALNSRKSTFLAEERWLQKPFQHHAPSDMQALITHVAILPAILERTDLSRTLPDDAATSGTSRLALALRKVLKSLGQWEERLRNNIAWHTDGSCCHPVSGEHAWFPNLMNATVCIHVWAFKIICFTELETLNAFRLKVDGKQKYGMSGANKKNQESAMNLANKICQSMGYLLQDEMKLYGPLSAVFPLKTAYAVLSKAGEGNEDNIMRCRIAFDQIHHKGFPSAPHLAQGFQSGNPDGTN
ncbi:hypothetical protein BCR34DRAFT_504920 [Clohesyomyces aquaticus]|uniref:Zn(2)-C6 fungal-type domain-containing protein n=1 Tax=Clohesyomyces aquaticus TaxID=1231657 RepID=A0A1Y2A798_9PLEO|nr:hypothetical protein BCR34DRAFT_504920 [Clohesyomyces aquaticus]